jgi:hypothetical protein
MYDDHQNLVSATARIKHSLQDEIKVTRTNLSLQVEDVNNHLVSKQVECAKQEGQNDALQKQNRDQQGSINGCLTEAMKMLAPEQEKLTVLSFDDDSSGNVAIKRNRWILLINKPVTPAKMIATCNRYIESMSASVIGSPNMQTGAGRLSSNTWEVDILSPAWTSTTPIIVSVSYRGSDTDLTCQFGHR